MFREMRRAKQQLPMEEAVRILEKRSHGILAVAGDDGYPYAVPMSYVYVNESGKIYFHCAVEGHKIDAIRRCDKVSFTVVDQDTVVAEEFTSYFRSVIVFGRARILTAPEEIFGALNDIAEKYSPHIPGREEEIASALSRVAIIELTPEHITGKEAKELMMRRNR